MKKSYVIVGLVVGLVIAGCRTRPPVRLKLDQAEEPSTSAVVLASVPDLSKQRQQSCPFTFSDPRQWCHRHSPSDIDELARPVIDRLCRFLDELNATLCAVPYAGIVAANSKVRATTLWARFTMVVYGASVVSFQEVTVVLEPTMTPEDITRKVKEVEGKIRSSFPPGKEI